MSNVIDLINAIEAGQTRECEASFESLIHAKIAEKIEERRAEISTGMFESVELDEASSESKIASLEKKIKDTQDALDALGITRERRTMKGQQRHQGPNEIALQKKIDDLRQQIDDIKRHGVVESEELDELSKSTLGSYVKKAGREASDQAREGGRRSRETGGWEFDKMHTKKQEKRLAGAAKAVERLTK